VKVHYSVFSVFMIAFLLLGHCVLIGNPILHAQTINTPTLSDKVGVKITFPKANSTLPVGTLTINGTSSDTTQTDCRVYVDWNDLKPMQNVTAAGINGTNDYSSWNFTYDQKYHIIAQGTNELTSKIICTNNPSGNTTTKFYSINITGTMSNSSSSLSPATNVPAALNQTVTNSSGYHTISYQGILPQYDRAIVNDDRDYVEKDKSSNDKNDDKAIANGDSNRVPKLSEDAEQEDSTEIVDTLVEDAEQEDSTEIVDTLVEDAEQEDSTEIVDTPVEVEDAEQEDSTEIVDTPVEVEDAEQEDSTEIVDTPVEVEDAEQEGSTEIVDTPVEVEDAEQEGSTEIVDTPVEDAEQEGSTEIVDTPVEDAEQEDSTEIVDTPVEDAEQEDSTEIEILKDDLGLSDLSSIHISNPDKESDLDEEPHLVSNQQLEGNDKSTAESNYQHGTISGFYSDVEDSIQPSTIKDTYSDLKTIKDIDLKDYKDKKGDDTKKKDKKSDAEEKKFPKKSILKKPSNIIEVIDPFKDT
jgi:hypothetical protein